MFKRILLALALAGLSAAALAQSNPGFVTGQVPTATQWNSYFSAKQDVLKSPPLLLTGGILTGPLTTAASSSSGAGLNLIPGVPPTVPKNGDIWVTSTGVFVRVNGATVGPLTAGFSSLTSNALVLGNGSSAPNALGSLGSTTTVLHGNASGAPTWGAVNLGTDVTGTLAAARLPNPTASTLGGVQSLASVAHKWINTISTSGVPAATQPAFTDISGTLAASQCPASTGIALGCVYAPADPPVTHYFLTGYNGTSWLSAQPAFTDISGTASHAQIPAPASGAGNYGGVIASNCAASNWAIGYSTSGTPVCTQPDFSDLTGTITAAQIPAPTAVTLGGINSITSASHNWIAWIGTDGTPHQSRPAFSDLSGSLAASQCPAATGLALGCLFAPADPPVTHYFVTGYNGTTWLTAQPAFSDLSGTLTAAQLPNPTSSTLGGVRSFAATTHKWINTISTSGVPAATQPDFSDLTGTLSAVQCPPSTGLALGCMYAPADPPVTHYFVTGYNGTTWLTAQPAFSDISGNVAASQLPLPTSSTLGGVKSWPSTPHQWINTISSVNGAAGATQPAFTDISGSVAASQLPNPSASTLGGVKSLVSVPHKWINTISTGGAPAATQPDFSDLSGSLDPSQCPAALYNALGCMYAPATPPVTHFFLTGYNGTAWLTAQPDFGDLTGTANLASQVSGVLPVANGGTGSSVPAIVATTSQFDKTTTSPTVITGLSSNVASSTTYYFKAILFVNLDGTGGIRARMGGTSTAISDIYEVQMVCDSSGLNVISTRVTDWGVSNGNTAGCTAGKVVMEGTVVVNAGGTLTAQFSQKVASGTSSVLVGSTLEVHQL